MQQQKQQQQKSPRPAPAATSQKALTGAELATTRAIMGLSQLQVAQQLGITRHMLDRWERDLTPVEEERVTAWLDALHKQLDTRLNILRARGIAIDRLTPEQIARAFSALAQGVGYW